MRHRWIAPGFPACRGLGQLAGLTLFLAAWSAIALAAPRPDSGVVALAVVNGDTIYSSDLDQVLIESHHAIAASEREQFDYRKLLTRLVNERLLIQEARALGVDEDSSLIIQLELERREKAARRWVRDNFKAATTVPDETILEYFRENFHRVSFRLIPCLERAEVEAVHAALMDGLSMDSLARAHSMDSYQSRGGLHQPIWYVDLEPTIRALADTLPVGQISAVFPYRSVYGVVRIEKIIPADTSELHRVRKQLETWFVKQENERAWEAFLEPVRQRLPIVDNEAALGRVRADSVRLFTPEFTAGSLELVMTCGDRVGITDQEFRTKLSYNAMTAATTPFDELYAQTYDELAMKLTVIAAAYADGYDRHPAIVAAYRHSLDSALVAICIAETVTPRIVFSHAEFDAYRREHPDEFRHPDQIQFDEMTVDSESVAMEIHERLSGGADFDYLARQYGARRPESEAGASPVDISTLPVPLQEEIGLLGVGGFPRPFRTDEGWLILKIKSRKEGLELSAEEAETRLRGIMFQQKFNAQLDSVLTILKSNATVEYDEDAIRGYFGPDS